MATGYLGLVITCSGCGKTFNEGFERISGSYTYLWTTCPHCQRNVYIQTDDFADFLKSILGLE